MIKSLAAFAIFATLSAAVIAVPAFAPMAKASEAVALAKGDRLAIHVAGEKIRTVAFFIH